MRRSRPDTLKEADAFWVNATKVEALLGLGRQGESDALKQQIIGTSPPPANWMIKSMTEQLAKLAALNP